MCNHRQDLDELAQMQEEIELLRSLHHPNIVTYLGTDVCDDNQTLYIFTEWVPGGSIQVYELAPLSYIGTSCSEAIVGTCYEIWAIIRSNRAEILGPATCGFSLLAWSAGYPS